MIGRLTGNVAEKNSPNLVVLDVHGVGYEVEVPISTFSVLPSLNEIFTLYIQQIVREDAILLYGFATKEEREAFRLLIKVSGIGPKSAIVILSGLSALELYQVIHDEDIIRLTKVPGIGKKTAERLILELKDKVKGKVSESGVSLESDLLEAHRNPIQDAVLALTALGYKASEAEKMVKQIAKENMAVDVMIKLALQAAMKK